MRFEGAHTFSVQRNLVWAYMHDPEVIARAIPDCEKLDQISANEFIAFLKIHQGPFSGEYKGTILLSDRIFEQEFSLGFSGSGPQGSIWGEGQISLSEKDGQTILSFEGEVEVKGKTASESPRLVRTTANALIRQFFAEIDHHIQIQTGIYTTEIVDRKPKKGRSGTIALSDVVDDVGQNYRSTTIVLILIALGTLMSFGGVAVLVMVARWIVRLFRHPMAIIAQIEQQKNTTINRI